MANITNYMQFFTKETCRKNKNLPVSFNFQKLFLQEKVTEQPAKNTLQ